MENKAQQDTETIECPMCGGTGGWPGVSGWVVCRPCNGTGVTESEEPA
jgi:DnaJ-class molecular chaperone